MPFLDEIAARLNTQGVGVVGATIFLSSKAVIPVGNGPFLSIIETGGSGSAKTQNDTATERPTAQLTTRASTYPAARSMMKAAYDALGGANGLYNIVLSGTFYLSITSRQATATDVGMDDAGRAMVTLNIDAEKAPS